jgi:heptaprenylglyceryl phosphate synthase
MATVRTRYDFQYFIIFSNMKSISLHKNALIVPWLLCSRNGCYAEEMVAMDQDR